jgi:hypothetical protein
MPKFKVVLSRVEYYADIIYVDADTQEDANEIAWVESGDWKLVDTEEFMQHIYLIEEKQNA